MKEVSISLVDPERLLRLLVGMDCPNGCGGKLSVAYVLPLVVEKLQISCTNCGFKTDPESVIVTMKLP